MATVQTPESKLVADYTQKLNACAQARQNYEKQWYMNLAMYFGRQWATWAPSVRGNSNLTLMEPPAPRWRVRLVANKIKPTIRNEFTKLIKEEAQFWVPPNSTDEADVAAARVADSVSEYLISSKHFNKKRRSATFWSVITGVGYIKTYYDPNKKDVDGIQGKICWEAPSPWHIFVPWLQIEDIQEQPYVFHAMTLDPDTVKTTFGKEIQPDSEVTGAQLDQKFKSALGIKNDKKKELNQVYVKEVWIKSNSQFPEGAMFIMAGNELLHMVEGIEPNDTMGLPVVGQVSSSFPYTHGQYPFAKIDHIPTGRYYGQSAIDDLIPLQREYNRTRSQLIEAKNRTSKPQLVVTKGSVDVNKITAEPGLIIEVNAGFTAPQALDNPDIPGYVREELDRTQRDMDEISGQYEIAKGRTPPGIEAASAIAYLQEENDTRLYHTVASIEEAVQDVGHQTLELVQQYWDEPRTVRVTGINNVYEVMQFKGQDIRGNTDFRVEPGSMAPRSRAAKQAFITELIKLGAIPPELGLKYLQLNETNRLYQELQLDARQAARENYRMRDGMALPTNEFDNDEAHIREHQNFMKTQEYELLPEEIQAAYLAHVREHKINLMGAMGGSEQTSEVPVEEENGPGQSEL